MLCLRLLLVTAHNAQFRAQSEAGSTKPLHFDLQMYIPQSQAPKTSRNALRSPDTGGIGRPHDDTVSKLSVARRGSALDAAPNPSVRQELHANTVFCIKRGAFK
jgi:hypothetical protein